MTGFDLVVGTYTDAILGSRVVAPTLPPPSLRVLASAHNPSYLAASSDGRSVYAVHETARGSITAFGRDRVSGQLTPLDTVPSGGDTPCHLAVSPDDRFVAVAHYGSGSVAVHSRNPDGSLGDLTALAQHVGPLGPDASRQDGPHAHLVGFDPVTGDVLATDLGLDAVIVHRLATDGALSEHGRIELASGAGPRHLVFHPGGRFLYVVNELANTVTVLRRTPARFVTVDTVSTLPPGVREHSQAGAIRLTTDARLLLVSNRGHDSVAVFTLDSATGALTLTHVEPTRGRQPRDLAVTPDDAHLLVANQASGTVAWFAIEATSVRFVASTEAPAPASLLWLPRSSSDA